MSRKKKEYIHVGIKMDAKVSEILEAYCNEKGMTKTAVIERAVLKYCSENKGNN